MSIKGPSLRDEEWYLDTSALRWTFVWARLRTFDDGSAEVLDCDGVVHKFSIVKDASHWLYEDEYSSLDALIEWGEVGPDTQPPSAESDEELVTLIQSAARDTYSDE
jgi:hypothetical protein